MILFRTMDLIQITHEPGHAEKGRWIEGKEVSIPFKGTAEPASGKVLQWLPEGKRSNDTILVFAPPELKFTTADSAKQVSGDIIVWDGRRYEVIVAKYWGVGGEVKDIDHWELVGSRKKEGES